MPFDMEENKNILFSTSVEKSIFPPRGKNNYNSNDFFLFSSLRPQLGFEFTLFRIEPGKDTIFSYPFQVLFNIFCGLLKYSLLPKVELL